MPSLSLFEIRRRKRSRGVGEGETNNDRGFDELGVETGGKLAHLKSHHRYSAGNDQNGERGVKIAVGGRQISASFDICHGRLNAPLLRTPIQGRPSPIPPSETTARCHFQSRSVTSVRHCKTTRACGVTSGHPRLPPIYFGKRRDVFPDSTVTTSRSRAVLAQPATTCLRRSPHSPPPSVKLPLLAVSVPL